MAMFISQAAVRIIDPVQEMNWTSKINKVLTESSKMFMESEGGHVPDQIVANIVHKKYTSMESITHTFCQSAYRFILMDPCRKDLIGTVLIAKCPDTILVKDSRNINVSASQNVGFSPENYHHAFNFAINMDYRKQSYAKYFISEIKENYRSLFSGKGIWIHAEPPWHAIFKKLGFRHATEFDQFFFEDVELPAYARTIWDFNKQFVCDCEKNDQHLECISKYKYKYQVFMMDFLDSNA